MLACFLLCLLPIVIAPAIELIAVVLFAVSAPVYLDAPTDPSGVATVATVAPSIPAPVVRHTARNARTGRYVSARCRAAATWRHGVERETSYIGRFGTVPSVL
jgi:hypothetical protein